MIKKIDLEIYDVFGYGVWGRDNILFTLIVDKFVDKLGKMGIKKR
jgi:hypothetical protein